MKHSFIIQNDNKEVFQIATYLREFYPITHHGKAGEGNGYYADNWKLIWRTPDEATDDGYLYRKWHLEFDDDNLQTLLVLKGLL